MYLKLYQADVSLGSGIKWKKCNLNYCSAIKLCQDYIEETTNKSPVDLKTVKHYEYLMDILNAAHDLGATFYAVDAGMGSFVVAFLFETKSITFKFIDYCNGLATKEYPIKAMLVPLNGSGKIK